MKDYLKCYDTYCEDINEQFDEFIEYLNKKDKKLRLLSNFQVDFEDLDLNF